MKHAVGGLSAFAVERRAPTSGGRRSARACLTCRSTRTSVRRARRAAGPDAAAHARDAAPLAAGSSLPATRPTAPRSGCAARATASAGTTRTAHGAARDATPAGRRADAAAGVTAHHPEATGDWTARGTGCPSCASRASATATCSGREARLASRSSVVPADGASSVSAGAAVGDTRDGPTPESDTETQGEES